MDALDPDKLSNLLETSFSLTPHERSELMKRAHALYLEAGHDEKALEAAWAAALFMHTTFAHVHDPLVRFVPIATFSDGTIIPDPAIFTDQALDYFERQAHATDNPILKSWYADFIWEHRHKHEFALMAIGALHDSYPLFVLNAAEEDPVKSPALERVEGEEAATRRTSWRFAAADSVVRPLRLARKLRQPELVKQAKQQLLAALHDFASGEPEPTFRFLLDPIDAMLEGNDLTKDDIETLLDLARRGEEHYETAGNLHLAQAFAKRTATLLHRQGDSAQARGAQIRVGEYIEREAQGTTSYLARAIWLGEAIKYYASIDRGDDVQRLKKDVSPAWQAARQQGEFTGRSVEIPIDLEPIQVRARRYLEGGIEAALIELGRCPEFVPSLDHVKELVNSLAAEFPLTRLVTGVQVEENRQIHKTDTPEESEEAAIREQYSLQSGLSGIFLHESIALFRNEGGLDVATVMAVLRQIPFIGEDQAELIERGLERYFDGDYISAIHILTPQLEDVMRRLVGQLGGTTTTFRDGVMTEKDLGHILNAPELATVFESDVLYFLKHVFVEKLGLNLRNRIGHGIVRPRDCTSPNCALVIQAFLRVSACEELRAKEDDSQDPATL